MTASEFLKDRNIKIIKRYKELRKEGKSAPSAKKKVSEEFGNIAVPTIEQIIYNKKYSNSPYS